MTPARAGGPAHAERPGPWVGDLVQDLDAGRRAVVTDVRGGVLWVLRPELGPGEWTSKCPERLAVVARRTEWQDRL